MLDSFYLWLAWKLPKRLVYWCAMRVNAHATLPPYGDQVVPELLAMDAIGRWGTGGVPEISRARDYA